MQKLLDIIKAFTGRYWLWLIVAAILLFIIFRSCKPLPSHKDDKKTSDSTAVVYAAEKKASLLEIARLKASEKNWHTRFDSLARQKVDLRPAAKAVRATLSSGDAAAIRRDTAAILVNWDSLRAEVKAGLPVVIANDSISMEMVNACVQEGMVKDSLIDHWQGLFYKADSAYALQHDKYNTLFSDYTKANRGLKFNKTLSRGLALGLIAAGIKIFILK